MKAIKFAMVQMDIIHGDIDAIMESRYHIVG